MSQFTPAQVFTPLTPLGEADAAVRQMQANRQAAEFGFSEALFQSFIGGPTGAIIRRAQSFGFDFDPAFSLDQMKLDDLTSPRYGVDRDLWENYAHAVSEKHLDFIHENNMIVMEKRRVLSGTGGVGGFAGQMIGSLADPGSVAVGLLTGGGSTVARMSLAGRAAFGATVAGGSNIALTSFQAAEDPAIGGSDILKAGLSGVGFGIAGGLTGPLGRLQRAGAGAAGQAAGPLMVDLWGNQDRAQTLMDLGTNLAFGGLFNAIHGPAARPEQVRMAETVDAVGRRMASEATGAPVDYSSSIPAVSSIVDPESLKHPFPADAVTGVPHSDTSILSPAESPKVIRTQVFKTEGEARVFAQALPNATVQQIFGTWTVLEGDRSYSRNSNLRLTPADIVTDLGLRTTIEGLSARGMTAEQIWTTIDGLDVAPRLDAETGRQFVDSARVDLRVPSRNKPDELARWAKAKGYDTAPLDDPAAFRASIDSAIAQELAKRNPNKSTGSGTVSPGNTAIATGQARLLTPDERAEIEAHWEKSRGRLSATALKSDVSKPEIFIELSPRHKMFEKDVLTPLLSNKLIDDVDAGVLRAVFSGSRLNWMTRGQEALSLFASHHIPKESVSDYMGGGDYTIGGAYNPTNHTIEVSRAVKNRSMMHVVLHELGHAMDTMNIDAMRDFHDLVKSGAVGRYLEDVFPKRAEKMRKVWATNRDEAFADLVVAVVAQKRLPPGILGRAFETVSEAIQYLLEKSRQLVGLEPSVKKRIEDLVDFVGGWKQTYKKSQAAAEPDQPGAVKPAQYFMGAADQPPDKTLGAATPTDTSQPGVQPTTDPTDLDLSELTRLQQTTPKAAYSAKTNVGGVDIGLMRFDMVGMVGGSEIPEFRAAARGIGLDWLVDEAGSPITYSAAEWVVDRHKAALADAYLPADRAFYEHRKGGGKMTRDEFDTAIGHALRRPTDPQADPHVASAAKAYRDVLNAIHERAVRHGVDIGYTPDYVPRRWSPEAIDAASAEIGAALMPTRDKATQFAAGREAVTKLLAESIEKAIEPTRGTVTIAGKSSPGWIREGSDQARARAEAIVQNGGRSATEDPTAKRIVMDETHKHDLLMPDGSTYTLSVEDLLENNAAVLLSGYSHRLHGKMAVSRLATVLGANMDGSLEVVEGITGIVNRLAETARERGVPEAQFLPDLKKIERMLKLAAGVPVYEHTTGTRILDAIRKIGMIRTMSNVGSAINNQVELVHAMAELGSANVMSRWVPAMKEVINLARTGQQGPQMARDLERIGIAIDRVTSRVLPRRGEELGHPVGRTAAEVWLARGERFAFDASLQSFSTDAARLATGMAFMDRWAELAMSGGGFSEARLAQMGLNPQQADGIMAQIKQHAVWADKPGGRLDHLGLEQWDPFLRRSFDQAASRTIRRLILENSPTSYAKWMSSPGGKVLAQLRTFAFGAHTAKFLAEVQMRDATTAYTIAFTTIGSAALYTSRVMLDAAVQKDRKKYLEERLAPDKVMKAAYSRAAYSALFPTAIDSLWSDMGRQDPIFSFARTSGLRGGGIVGNPTVDFLNETGFSPLDFDPLRVPRAIAAPVIPGYQFSRQDYRALKSGLAIPDILNLRKLMDRYAQDLPPTSN